MSWSSVEEAHHMDVTVLSCTVYCLNAVRRLVSVCAALRSTWKNRFPHHCNPILGMYFSLIYSYGANTDTWDSRVREDNVLSKKE